jgi:predicted ATP-binding protein involved in virulence
MLPIALKSFHIKNYRGIIDTKVDNIPPNTQWIFLTGENGFGKTSVLQGIAMVASPVFQLQSYYYKHIEEKQSEKPEILIDFICYGVPSYAVYPNFTVDDLKGNANNSQLIDITSKIIAYGSTRLRVSGGTTKEVMDDYSSVDSLFSNNTLLINIEEQFNGWYSNYREGYEQLVKIFKTLLPRLGKISVDRDPKTKLNKTTYYEEDLEHNIFGEGVIFNDLAAGYKNILAMIGDMIIRFSQTQSVEDLKNLIGIVLIDEIDLHLHPKYQKLFVQKLTELFPKIQFIVSTHSPIPLLGSPPNSVIINVSRTREDGIKAELLDIDFSVLTPNAILSSPIFGFQDLIPDSKSDDKMIRTEDTFQEVEFNDQLKKNINQFLTKERQEELLKLIKVKQS